MGLIGLVRSFEITYGEDGVLMLAVAQPASQAGNQDWFSTTER
ncbi:hypothetical protein [Brevibacillus sp. HB2.2]|nr:hypothetical protein [Brevibacillus sp. HB2.2]